MDGMLEVKRMDEIERDVSTEVAIVFVDGYYNELRLISKNKEKLILIFKNSFVKEVFYVALMDGNVAGILACSNNKLRAIHLNKEDIIANLGFIKGNFVFFLIEKEFHTPISYDDSTAYIESVATITEARGKGVATRLLEHVYSKLPYQEFRLTVKDSNKAAISIYKKLGFKQFDKMKAGFFEKKHFKYKLYMKLVRRNQEERSFAYSDFESESEE